MPTWRSCDRRVGGWSQAAREPARAWRMPSKTSRSARRAESMESLPASLAERLRELTYKEQAVAYLEIDAALTLVGAGGHLENYGLAAIRLGEPAVEQAFFLEGLLPLDETAFFVPSIELDCGRAADLH